MNNLLKNAARLTLLFAVIVFLALTGVPKLNAQATDSVIVGTVTDATGAAVGKATITATNKGTNVKYTTVTSPAGEYRINSVPVGRYDIAASATGFAVATVANVQTELNHTAAVNLSLAVGAVTTTVEVQESAALIDTSTSTLQTSYDSSNAIGTAMAGSSKIVGGTGIYNLSLLGAGVASQGGIGQGVGPSIAGQRPEGNSFTIDGVLNDDHYTTGPVTVISNEAVSQLNIIQNQFSAEFGGASGGVFNVIVKSGTNQIHGSIYEYLQNRDLNAVDYSTVVAGFRSNTRFDNNRLGATVGGPIKKDKLFYFGNFEYNPLGQATQPGQPVFAPTQAGLNILNGMAGLSKTNLGVFEKFVPIAPTASSATPITVNGVSIPNGPLSFASASYFNTYNIVGAVDWNIGNSDQLRGRYLYNSSVGIDFNAFLPVFFQPQPTHNNSIVLSEFHNFSPTMINELRVSYFRTNQQIGAGDYKFPGLDSFPNISLDDLSMQIGPDPNTPSGSIQNTSQLQETLTKSWGHHTFKAGYNLTDIILSGYFIQRSRGDYDYTSLEEFLADRQPTGGAFGTPTPGERSVGGSPGLAQSGAPFGFLQNAAFFQDDWRIRPNLTLNLGVRYEYVTVPVGSRAQQYSSIANVPGVITFGTPQSANNEWAPRIGFAYSPGKDQKWSIRGGVARSYYNTYINLNQNAAPPYYQTTVDVNTAAPVTNFLANGGLSPAAPPQTTAAQARAAIATYTFDQTRPYALTGTLGVQRLLGRDYTIEVRYVHTKGVHLWNQTRINGVPEVTPTNFIPTFLTLPSAGQFATLTKTLGTTTTPGSVKGTLPPGATTALPSNSFAVYGFKQAIVGYHPWGNSKYDGVSIQMNKRYSQNFSYIAAYTWSHALDDSSATNFSTILSPRRAQDYQNMRAEWASSGFDRRQRLTITPMYDWKPFRNGNYVMKNIVGNWSISGTYTFQSPEFAVVQSGVDSNLNGGDSLDRSIINPAGAANLGSGVTGYNAAGQPVAANSASIVAYVANNPNARYIVAGAGALSNAGRNTFPLGRINNIDMSLAKKIDFTERTSLSIGGQFSNVLNHSQFVGGYISDASYYKTAAISRNFLVPSNAAFGQYNQFFPSNSRTIQVFARIVF